MKTKGIDRKYKVYKRHYAKEPFLIKIGRQNHKKFLELLKVGFFTNFPIAGSTQPRPNLHGEKLYKIINPINTQCCLCEEKYAK